MENDVPWTVDSFVSPVIHTFLFLFFLQRGPRRSQHAVDKCSHQAGMGEAEEEGEPQEREGLPEKSPEKYHRRPAPKRRLKVNFGE
jgi:hypothetical protein